jgi:hypothetical protein
VLRRSRLWITYSLVVSTVEKLGSACFGSSAWRIWPPRGRSQSRSSGCESGRRSPSLPVKALIPWSGWSLGCFGKRGTDASTSGRLRNRWSSQGSSQRTRVCGLERASCRSPPRWAFVAWRPRCVLPVVFRSLGPWAQTRLLCLDEISLFLS